MDTNKGMKIIRWLNFVSLNLCVLLLVPPFLVYKLKIKANLFVAASNSGFLGFYLFIFFSLWVFIYFLIQEVSYCINNKVSFFKHIFSNWLVFWGILPIFVYLFLKFNKL